MVALVIELYLKYSTTLSTDKVGFEAQLETRMEFGLPSISACIEFTQP